MGEHLLLELLDEHGVWPHKVLAGGQEVLGPSPHGGWVNPETVPDTGHSQTHQHHQSSEQHQDNPDSQDFDEIDWVDILTKHGGVAQGLSELEFRLVKIVNRSYFLSNRVWEIKFPRKSSYQTFLHNNSLGQSNWESPSQTDRLLRWDQSSVVISWSREAVNIL